MGERDIGRRDFIAKGAFAASAVVGGVAAGVAGCQETKERADKPTKPLKVRYGLNLLLYTATFSKDQVGLVKKVADMGYDGVEVPFNDLSVLDPKATRKAKEEAGVGLTACCVMMPGTNLCSTDPAERKAGVERIKKMVDITAEMGGADATKMVKEINNPRLKVQVDTFHCNIEEKDTAAAIRACGSWVGHFHASECDRGVPGTDLCAAACIWRPIYESADGLARDGLAFLKKTAAEA